MYFRIVCLMIHCLFNQNYLRQTNKRKPKFKSYPPFLLPSFFFSYLPSFFTLSRPSYSVVELGILVVPQKCALVQCQNILDLGSLHLFL